MSDLDNAFGAMGFFLELSACKRTIHANMRHKACNKTLRNISRIFILAALPLTICALPSCHSSKGSTAQEVSSRPASKLEGKKHKPDTPAASSKMGKALVSEARKWIGTPYVYGGHSRKGTDCSGFLMEVFRECAGISLPRSSRDQQAYCHPIDREYLAVGDLIFFSSRRSGGRVSHVGMYIGNGRMIHASSSRGVVEDNLSSQYFVTYYHGAGRVPQLAKANPVPTKETQTRTNPSSEAAGGNSSAARTPEKQRTNSQPKPECDKGSKVQQPGTQTSEHKPTQTMPAQNVRPQTAHQDTTATTCPETIVRNAFSKTKKK